MEENDTPNSEPQPQGDGHPGDAQAPPQGDPGDESPKEDAKPEDN